MKAFIYGQRWKEEDEKYFAGLLEKLDEHNIHYCLYTEYANQIEDNKWDFDLISDHEQLRQYKPEVIITLGGDGTILSAATIIKELEIPILGINMGRLGFLASIEQERIDEAIELLVKKEYSISERAMLRLEVEPDIFKGKSFALNDFTLQKRDNASMIVIHTYIDGNFLNSYWADGLIVSTATGSTGYSLSCGGPIMYPSSDSFIITPIAPHNLNVRPFVISSEHELSFKIEGRTENFLCSLDSRNAIITTEHKLILRKNHFTTKLIQLHGDGFMRTIRNKLNWGMDKRN